jgi:hypothetical protein
LEAVESLIAVESHPPFPNPENPADEKRQRDATAGEGISNWSIGNH